MLDPGATPVGARRYEFDPPNVRFPRPLGSSQYLQDKRLGCAGYHDFHSVLLGVLTFHG
jgi:hypothetical protein